MLGRSLGAAVAPPAGGRCGGACSRHPRSPSAQPSAARQCRAQRLVRIRSSREDAIAALGATKSAVSNALAEKEKALKDGRQSAGWAADSSEGAAGSSDLPDLRELTKDDFQSCLDEAGDKLVVVDFYTDWCGPCKVIYPTLQQMAHDQREDVLFTKLNCNKYNKELGRKAGVKVAPTFQLYRRGEKVAEMTGAKVDDLQDLVDEHK